MWLISAGFQLKLDKARITGMGEYRNGTHIFGVLATIVKNQKNLDLFAFTRC